MNFLKNIKGKKASYIVEAALTLPVFIICIIALSLIINIISICESTVFIVAREVREISLNENVVYQTVPLCKRTIENNVFNENEKLREFEVNSFLKNYYKSGIHQLIKVRFSADFNVLNPIGVNGSTKFEGVITARCFTGKMLDHEPLAASKFTEDESSKKVIVFPKYGYRYHIGDCPHVVRVKDEERYIEMELEDAKSKGYTPCLICGGD